VLKSGGYVGNSGRGKAGTGFLGGCHMLGTDTGVTIKTRFDESVAMGAAWHVVAGEGLELKTMILSCCLGGWLMTNKFQWGNFFQGTKKLVFFD
jgi:hypothetical protein